ncbi:ABC transporter permease [candidate division KSB1 bacterium]|nr:ABC transporter permease [candidate division KSB1 bacterium]
MTYFQFIRKSMLFNWRSHLLVLLAAAVGTTILVGSLIVGDSVRYSMQQITLNRLGDVNYAIETGDRYFQAGLANALADTLHKPVTSMLHIRGLVKTNLSKSPVGDVQVYGIQSSFSKFWTVSDSAIKIGFDEAIINNRLATKLGVQVGDEILVRVEKTGVIPTDAPLIQDTDRSVALRLTIHAIADAHGFGEFNLRTNQVPPYNLFVAHDLLATKLDLSDRANVLLFAELHGESDPLDQIQNAIKQQWTLADVSLTIRHLENKHEIELSSDRIFIEPQVEPVAEALPLASHGLFTYLTNSLTNKHGQSTPYSFVCAGSSYLPANMSDEEISVSSWLADDLKLKPGQQLTLAYYVLGPQKRLLEQQRTFRVHDIYTMNSNLADSTLMPSFPGIAGSNSCRDWDPGIPIDLDKIRDKDEAYWNTYRGTPKAHITLAAGQAMWGNRFGDLTAIRYSDDKTSPATLGSDILDRLNPAAMGFVPQPVKDNGLQAGVHAVDFGQLFLSLSFFILVAALILTGMLFVFSIETRAEEIGTLYAMGFSSKSITRMLLGEGLLLALSGGIIGAVLGVLYNEALLLGLRTIWREAVGDTVLLLHVVPMTLAIGFVSGLVASMLAMWLAIRKLARKTISELHGSERAALLTTSKRRVNISYLIAGLTGVLAIALLLIGGIGQNAGLFFGAGTLLLVASQFALYAWLLARTLKTADETVTLNRVGMMAMTRRRGRSLATAGLLACGVFLVVAVGANRQDIGRRANVRSSGTGGFTFWAETTIPITRDLNTEDGRAKYGLETLDSLHVSFMPLRLREGDDASCLNLNRISQPKILGVNPVVFDSLHAFTFATRTEDINAEHPWLTLKSPYADDVIPGIADQTVIQWGLGKVVGDTLHYTDENGRTLNIRLVGGLANSIFQGNVLIDQKLFEQYFPSISGSNVLIVDTSLANESKVADELAFALQDYGLNLQTTVERLQAFHTIENTYLSIFLMLGGFGLIIGVFGFGIVAARNIWERRSELALLKATGFPSRTIFRLILIEHRALLIIGVITGAISAAIAVLPSVLAPGVKVPIIMIALILLEIVGIGLIVLVVVTHRTLKGDLVPALRKE